MKVAVTTAGNDANADVDPRFGRVKNLLIFDTETGEHEILDNSANLGATQGAGIQTAKRVAESGAEALITGHCGPNAFRTLEAAGIQVITGVEGRISDALTRFQEGSLKPANGADVQGHW
ncbi:MAG: NifB/NifX family molybdenum-iron cluster-binding protein [Candidatus Eisenbacteria sp.]|nr:NifB/NifX family molybdenum-iron cluster-binding protein [Candidatus Eisenbacteria bacterium]